MRPRLTMRRTGLSALAALLCLSGIVLVAVAFHGRPPSPPTPAPVHTSAQRPSALRADKGAEKSSAQPSAGTGRVHSSGGVPDAIAGTVLAASKPLSVAIPRLHVASPLVRLGLDGSGAMKVPSDPALAGWYDRGPSPGELGPAVIAGHVTWNRQPAVFFRLGALGRGDRIGVVRRDGLTAVFAVTDVRRYPKVRFPTRSVFGTIDYAGLRVITCGGTYDATAHRYLDNIVVFARLVAVRGAGT